MYEKTARAVEHLRPPGEGGTHRTLLLCAGAEHKYDGLLFCPRYPFQAHESVEQYSKPRHILEATAKYPVPYILQSIHSTQLLEIDLLYG